MATETLDNPRGIFDRQSKGKEIKPVRVQIERGRIRFFAQVLGEKDPVHHNVEAARKAGFRDIVAPSSFFMVVEALANEELVRGGEKAAVDLVKCDFRYLLHGDERYFYFDALCAGDDVEFHTRVVDFYDKKGGAMEFVTLESEICHPERGVLVRSRRNLLHRLPEQRGVE